MELQDSEESSEPLDDQLRYLFSLLSFLFWADSFTCCFWAYFSLYFSFSFSLYLSFYFSRSLYLSLKLPFSPSLSRFQPSLSRSRSLSLSLSLSRFLLNSFFSSFGPFFNCGFLDSFCLSINFFKVSSYFCSKFLPICSMISKSAVSCPSSSPSFLYICFTNYIRGYYIFLEALAKIIMMKYRIKGSPEWKFSGVQLSTSEGSWNLQKPPKSMGISSLSLMSSEGSLKYSKFL